MSLPAVVEIPSRIPGLNGDLEHHQNRAFLLVGHPTLKKIHKNSPESTTSGIISKIRRIAISGNDENFF